jgi:hypothetical protein
MPWTDATPMDQRTLRDTLSITKPCALYGGVGPRSSHARRNVEDLIKRFVVSSRPVVQRWLRFHITLGALFRLTLTSTGRGERMRASGPGERDVTPPRELQR